MDQIAVMLQCLERFFSLADKNTNDVQIQGVIGVSVVVKPQTCVQLFEEEDGGKGEGKESWMSRWLEARETQKELTVKQEESGWKQRVF